MDLYKIMLVDDEEEVRTSIIKKINWEENGFVVAGDAENGRDALEKIEYLEPDVVMTDIKMPYLDGLQFTEAIKKKFPSIKVIIFSGFDDFSYAKEAIRLGVTEYVLKPVNVEELTEILRKVKIKLDEEIESARDMNFLREKYKSMMPILRENFLNRLIMSGVSKEEVKEKLSEYGTDIGNAKKWVVAVADIEMENASIQSELLEDKALLSIYVKKYIEDQLQVYCRQAVFESVKDSRIVIISALDEENTQTGLTDIFRDICKNAKRVLGVGITIGMGKSSQYLASLVDSYKSAVDAIGYKRIVGSGDIVYIYDVEPVNTGVLKFEETEETELISAIKFGPQERIDGIVNLIVEKMASVKVHSRQYQAYMLSVMACVIGVMQRYEVSLIGIDNLVEMVSQISRSEDFKEKLSELCNSINAALKTNRESTSKKVVLEAKDYISENYRNPELTLENMCRHLHLSPAYFSTLFKKETGQTCIAYLTEFRLNKAVELLDTTELKTYMIGSLVGYPDQNYFSYAFKKKYGISPTKYRAGK